MSQTALPESIDRAKLMAAIRDLGIDPTVLTSFWVTPEGVMFRHLVNDVPGGRNQTRFIPFDGKAARRPMDDLLAWLRGQLDDDEAQARRDSEFFTLNSTGDDLAIARDVQWRLADITAKRAILDEEIQPTADYWADRAAMSDAELHARCLHPGWEYETTQGQRKAWYDQDTPPEGDGWVRNVEYGGGGEGWERFDYHEESYWRRPRDPSEIRRPRLPRLLVLLALPYADRPGYRDEWRP